MANIGKFSNAMDAARQGQAHIEVMEATLAANPGWSKVDTVDSPGGQPCHVWKCSGATNGMGADWYLFIARTMANPVSTVFYACAEGYDPINKRAIRPAPGSNRTTVPAAADGSYGGGSGYPIWTGTTGSSPNLADIMWRNHTYASAYIGRVVVTKQSFTVMWWVSNATHDAHHFGLIDQLFSANGTALSTSARADGVITRHPGLTAANGNGWLVSGPNTVWTQRSGQYCGYGEKFFGNVPVGSRSAALIGTTSNANAVGHLYGLYRNTLTFNNFADTYCGDEITVGSQKYMVAGPNSAWYRTDID